MVDMELVYQGDKRCELKHGPSGIKIETDAPVDNHGKGQAFSPTDLMTISLGACMTTILAIQLEKKGVDLSGTRAKITKHMVSNPRRVGQIEIKLFLGAKVPKDLEVEVMEICRTCPVHLSLSKDIQIDIQLLWA